MRVLLVLVVAAFAVPSTIAEHSASSCQSTITPVGVWPAMLYLVEDHADDETWLYMESNGHPWVQRGGEAWYSAQLGQGYHPDWCWDIDLGTDFYIEDPDLIVL